MAAVPSNNAFGAHAVSWNLSFPAGNLTAAEILAYAPHWLKSIDVIDRFICHGAHTRHIAAIINEFRRFPEDGIFKPNSTMIMMSYSMRRAGFFKWSVGSHLHFPREFARPDDDLDVTNFRTPRITHPKVLTTSTSQDLASNREYPPVDFKLLAKNIKKHPSGNDALDLARCVQYALQHPDEVWLFPTDFQRLIIHLGGAAPVTPAHFDRQAFARRNHIRFPVSKPALKQSPEDNSDTELKIKIERFDNSTTSGTMSRSATSKKRSADSLDNKETGNKRRSGRLVGKNINFAEDSEFDLLDKDSFASQSAPAAKKRKVSRARRSTNPAADDEDFIAGETEPDDDIADEDDGDLEEPLPPTGSVRGRKAAQKARAGIKSAFVPDRAPHELTPLHYQVPSSHSWLSGPPASSFGSAYADTMFTEHAPAYLQPPLLNPNRLIINEWNVKDFSERQYTEFKDMYASIYDYARFYGPSPFEPFRELHLVSDPYPQDVNDFAENIRWAKEQWEAYGSVWTELPEHLHQITAHRLHTGWISKEAIAFGHF
ncbi:uncharacterized protein SETTUDRAFT_110094 [Exserohilum turcica Et28A]|uniref:Uncharacterized protein n=1 Tax=Exserohilum turcicum (strain 28A) TaxID=671987 RepID=R0IN22_EXST2|nr:uncharacterized protein SETTUDRAFT_110094 [Exserohilum turcica Et28A]EOA86166.1 hypothetical protein SETTUDRAFT_110094 [Exserohilum turcica Et28A]